MSIKQFKTIIKEKNLELDNLWEYLNEAFKFCEYRKFNFVDMKDIETDFSFDFVKADRNNFAIDLKEIRQNVKIKFYYENEKDIFKKYLAFYGNSDDSKWGKIIQIMDWIRMRKRIKYAEGNEKKF